MRLDKGKKFTFSRSGPGLFYSSFRTKLHRREAGQVDELFDLQFKKWVEYG